MIVFDDVLGMGTWAAELRAKGKAVVGGTPTRETSRPRRELPPAEQKNRSRP